jgi:SAM-dependent methyltransferase
MSEDAHPRADEIGIAQHRPTERFTARVDAYMRYRPGYPDAMIETLAAEAGLTQADVVADVGCGTGISSALFLRNGNRVYGIEPNAAMREAATAQLDAYDAFTPIDGAAEATTLEDDTVDYVVAGQALHWFRLDETRIEFARILRPGGWIALFWNLRNVEASPFMDGYETLLKRYSPDYDRVHRTRLDDADYGALFECNSYQARSFANRYWLDFTAVMGRTASSSYAPTVDDPAYSRLEAELEALFDAHAVNGLVRFEYTTELLFGHGSQKETWTTPA